MPMDLEQLRAAVREGKRFKYLCFWGHRPRADGSVGPGCLSQWWPSPFEVDGVRYATAEHYMMAGKARLFGDDEALQRILESSSPSAAKRFGRQVRRFSQPVWDANAYDIVVQGNVAKFSQHEAEREFLLATKNRVLVEASPRDRIWGIGLDASDGRCERPLKWQGTNLLGFALMDVRDRLSASAGD